MNIKAFSKLVGISSHTLRYYGKLGLLGSLRRAANGHRDFSQNAAIAAKEVFAERGIDRGNPE